MPKKAITVTLDEKLDKKIRNLQAKIIEKSKVNWSYSSVVGMLIEEGMKSFSPKSNFNKQK